MAREREKKKRSNFFSDKFASTTAIIIPPLFLRIPPFILRFGMVNSSKGRRKGRKETRSIFILEFGHLRSKTHSPFRCPSWGHTATGSLIFLQQTQKEEENLELHSWCKGRDVKKDGRFLDFFHLFRRKAEIVSITNTRREGKKKEGNGKRNKETEKASRWKINAGHKFAPCLYKSKPRSR